MYLLFRLKNWEPQKYFEMGYGARKVVTAFLLQEIEDREREMDNMKEG